MVCKKQKIRRNNLVDKKPSHSTVPLNFNVSVGPWNTVTGCPLSPFSLIFNRFNLLAADVPHPNTMHLTQR